MDLFLGVDAGGTKTRAVVADATGAVCGVGEAGTGNWQAVGAEAAGVEVRKAVARALAAAGVVAVERGGVKRVRGSFFGLAGVRTAAERAVMAAEVVKLELGGVVELAGDLAAAHAGALEGGPGVVVIAGTGSAAWGKNAAGETAQAGGWGWLVDDKGGGYWLALRGLAAACEAEDGRGAATGLGARAVAFFLGGGAGEGGVTEGGKGEGGVTEGGAAGCGDPALQRGVREVLRELHAGRRDRAAVAGFAREVRAAAEAGDEVARGLIAEAAAELLRLAEAVRARVAPDPDAAPGEWFNFPLAVTGGLEMGPAIANEAWSRCFKPVEPWGEPVLGAVLLAARAGGAELDAAARARLLAGWKTRG